jgi:hypothetical protein
LPSINNAEEINFQWFPVFTTGGSLVLSGIQEKKQYPIHAYTSKWSYTYGWSWM